MYVILVLLQLNPHILFNSCHLNQIEKKILYLKYSKLKVLQLQKKCRIQFKFGSICNL